MGKIKRIAAATVATLLCLSGAALAEKAKMRSASESEIRAHIDEYSKRTSKKNNGFTYQAGSSRGYKIKNGEICVLFATGRTDCASIETNGSKFEMITRDGDRSTF